MEELVELLPNLHIIGSKLEKQKFTDDDDKYLEHEVSNTSLIEIGQVLAYIKAPCTLQLQHLALDDIDEVLENVSLPELLVLELCRKIAMHPCLVGGSPKLSELYVYKMHQATLMPALGHIGQQLQVLILDLLDLPWLDLVLEACPNLTELHIHTFEGGVGYRSQLQADSLKHLQIAEFNVTRGPFDSELLMQILRLASKLRSIEVDSITFVFDDWEMLAELAKEGTCMQHLETIKITCRLLPTRTKQRLVAKTRVDFSVSCPKLQVFSCDLVEPPPPPPLDPNPHCSIQ